MSDAASDAPSEVPATIFAIEASESPARPRRSRDETRAAVLRAAIALAERAPYRDLTVDEIAREAGISRSAFYLHFRDRSELLAAALGEVAGELERLAGRWWANRAGPAVQVREAVSGFVAAYGEHAAVLRLAGDASVHDEELRRLWLAMVGRLIEATSAQIAAEQRRGTIGGQLDPVAAAEALVWMSERCCRVYLAGGARSAEELVEQLTGVWTAALYPGVIAATELRPDAPGDPLWGVPAPEFEVTDTRSHDAS